MSRPVLRVLILLGLVGGAVASGQNANSPGVAEAPPPSGRTVFVLVIDTPDDVITSVAATEEAAVRELYKYVRQKWNSPVPLPADDDDAVDLFFESGGSDYEIREQPLLGDVAIIPPAQPGQTLKSDTKPTKPFTWPVERVGNGVSQPRVISKVDPDYTEEARAKQLSGTVTLAVVVGADGVAHDLHVVKPLGMGLDGKAIEAVQKWKFAPAIKAGQPVNVSATIDVNFRLLDKDGRPIEIPAPKPTATFAAPIASTGVSADSEYTTSQRIQIPEPCPLIAKWITQMLSSGSHLRLVSYEPELGLLTYQSVFSEPDPVLPADVTDFVKKRDKTVNISGIVFTLRSLVSTSLSFEGSPAKSAANSCTISTAFKFVSKNSRILESSGMAEKEMLDLLKKRYAEHGVDF
jgi:TonB family protein